MDTNEHVQVGDALTIVDEETILLLSLIKIIVIYMVTDPVNVKLWRRRFLECYKSKYSSMNDNSRGEWKKYLVGEITHICVTMDNYLSQ